MARKLSVTIVGPGSLGSALARSLYEVGIPVVEIVYRSSESAKRARAVARSVDARAVAFDDAGFGGQVIWLSVGDSVLRDVAARMARSGWFAGKIVFHSSGALAANEIAPFRRAGASVASVHPMMTFVRSSATTMKGVPFAVEGDREAVAVAKRLVQQLEGNSFVIKKNEKPLYHALGAFVSPLIVGQMAAVERIGRELGFNAKQTRRIIAPILQQTIRNYLEHGPAAAFSGPIVRGDAETVRKNLKALKRVRGAAEIYRALAKMAVEELPSKDAAGIKRMLR